MQWVLVPEIDMKTEKFPAWWHTFGFSAWPEPKVDYNFAIFKWKSAAKKWRCLPRFLWAIFDIFDLATLASGEKPGSRKPDRRHSRHGRLRSTGTAQRNDRELLASPGPEAVKIVWAWIGTSGPVQSASTATRSQIFGHSGTNFEESASLLPSKTTPPNDLQTLS